MEVLYKSYINAIINLESFDFENFKEDAKSSSLDRKNEINLQKIESKPMPTTLSSLKTELANINSDIHLIKKIKDEGENRSNKASNVNLKENSSKESINYDHLSMQIKRLHARTIIHDKSMRELENFLLRKEEENKKLTDKCEILSEMLKDSKLRQVIKAEKTKKEQETDSIISLKSILIRKEEEYKKLISKIELECNENIEKLKSKLISEEERNKELNEKCEIYSNNIVNNTIVLRLYDAYIRRRVKSENLSLQKERFEGEKSLGYPKDILLLKEEDNRKLSEKHGHSLEMLSNHVPTKKLEEENFKLNLEHNQELTHMRGLLRSQIKENTKLIEKCKDFSIIHEQPEFNLKNIISERLNRIETSVKRRFLEDKRRFLEDEFKHLKKGNESFTCMCCNVVLCDIESLKLHIVDTINHIQELVYKCNTCTEKRHKLNGINIMRHIYGEKHIRQLYGNIPSK